MACRLQGTFDGLANVEVLVDLTLHMRSERSLRKLASVSNQKFILWFLQTDGCKPHQSMNEESQKKKKRVGFAR
jgi:hypothetical protein